MAVEDQVVDEQRVAENTEAADCEACSERISQCECDEPWQGPFRFCQLSEQAKDRAVDREGQASVQDYDPVDEIDWEVEAIGYLGFEIGTEQVRLGNGTSRDKLNLHYSLGDRGEYCAFPCNWSAEKLDLIKLHEHASDEELLALGIQLSAVMMAYPTAEAKITCNHRTNLNNASMDAEFYPEGGSKWTIDDSIEGHELDRQMTELARDVASWLLGHMRSTWEDCFSRERCEDNIEANEYRFDEDGDMA